MRVRLCALAVVLAGCGSAGPDPAVAEACFAVLDAHTAVVQDESTWREAAAVPERHAAAVAGPLSGHLRSAADASSEDEWNSSAATVDRWCSENLGY